MKKFLTDAFLFDQFEESKFEILTTANQKLRTCHSTTAEPFHWKQANEVMRYST